MEMQMMQQMCSEIETMVQNRLLSIMQDFEKCTNIVLNYNVKIIMWTNLFDFVKFGENNQDLKDIGNKGKY